MYQHHSLPLRLATTHTQPTRRLLLLSVSVVLISIVCAVEGRLIGVCSAAPHPSDRRQNNNNNFFEVRGANEVFDSNHHRPTKASLEAEEAVVDRSFGAMDTTATTTVAPVNVIADHSTDATMECNQAKELLNVQTAFEKLYPDLNLESYYFCSRSSPKDFYCYCGVASVCHDFHDPWE